MSVVIDLLIAALPHALIALGVLAVIGVLFVAYSLGVAWWLTKDPEP